MVFVEIRDGLEGEGGGFCRIFFKQLGNFLSSVLVGFVSECGLAMNPFERCARFFLSTTATPHPKVINMKVCWRFPVSESLSVQPNKEKC